MGHIHNSEYDNWPTVLCAVIAEVMWEGFMWYATGRGSSAMINIPGFIKIGSSIQKLIGGIHGHRGD
jgi:hypothetical protein